ncbi:MAG: hypothetical protein Aurels2KO_54140 [Aureliella sp.]
MISNVRLRGFSFGTVREDATDQSTGPVAVGAEISGVGGYASSEVSIDGTIQTAALTAAVEDYDPSNAPLDKVTEVSVSAFGFMRDKLTLLAEPEFVEEAVSLHGPLIATVTAKATIEGRSAQLDDKYWLAAEYNFLQSSSGEMSSLGGPERVTRTNELDGISTSELQLSLEEGSYTAEINAVFNLTFRASLGYFEGKVSEGQLSAIRFRDGATPEELGIQLDFCSGRRSPNTPEDFDGDGLSDLAELDLGTDPENPDTDEDGLLDGIEVDIAEGTGCPSPLNPDSDGDSLPDGLEIEIGTSPCSPDTDGDGLDDDVDPTPTVPGFPADFVEQHVRLLSAEIQALGVSAFTARTDRGARGRQNALATRLLTVARLINRDRPRAVIAILSSVLQRVDGAASPPDWMYDSIQKTKIAAELRFWIEFSRSN